MKMFEPLNQSQDNQEPAPSDAVYSFGSPKPIGIKIATYAASALALGGSLFISNQLLTPPNLKGADQANAQSQPVSSTEGGNPTSATLSGENADTSAGSESTNGGILTQTDSGSTGSSATTGSTSIGKNRLAAWPNSTSNPTAEPTAAPADPTPTPSNDPVIVTPPPTFNHGNTSSATPGASAGSSGSYGGENESDGNHSDSGEGNGDEGQGGD
jgi:hypothetical protein